MKKEKGRKIKYKFGDGHILPSSKWPKGHFFSPRYESNMSVELNFLCSKHIETYFLKMSKNVAKTQHFPFSATSFFLQHITPPSPQKPHYCAVPWLPQPPTHPLLNRASKSTYKQSIHHPALASPKPTLQMAVWDASSSSSSSSSGYTHRRRPSFMPLFSPLLFHFPSQTIRDTADIGICKIEINK